MSEKKKGKLLQRKPHGANGGGIEGWWYEFPWGIEVYSHKPGSGRVDYVRIRWAALLNAAKRAGR